MDSCNFANKANSHTPKVEISAGEKLCHFARYVGKVSSRYVPMDVWYPDVSYSLSVDSYPRNYDTKCFTKNINIYFTYNPSNRKKLISNRRNIDKLSFCKYYWKIVAYDPNIFFPL